MLSGIDLQLGVMIICVILVTEFLIDYLAILAIHELESAVHHASPEFRNLTVNGTARIGSPNEEEDSADKNAKYHYSAPAVHVIVAKWVCVP